MSKLINVIYSLFVSETFVEKCLKNVVTQTRYEKEREAKKYMQVYIGYSHRD